MKWWNRGLESLKFRWKSNLLLFLVIVLASALLLPAYSIRDTADAALVNAQKEISAYVNMMRTDGNWDSVEEANYYSPELAEEIAKLPQVKQASHMTAVNLYSTRIRGIDVGGEVRNGEDVWKAPKYNPDWGQPYEGWVQIVGVTNLEDYWDFRSCGAQIVEGRGIMPEDAGKEIMVLSNKVYSDNQIRIGEKAAFQSYFDENAVYELELVGVHDGKIWHGYGNSGDSVNFVYAPLDVALKFYNGIMESRYELENPEDLEAFTEAAKKIAEQYGEDVKFVGDSIHYLTTSAALKNVGKTGDAVILSVLLIAGLVICLLVAWSMLGRTREIGIWLAMGETKLRLTGQLFIEMLLPIAAGVLVSLLPGKLLASPVSRLLVGDVPGMEGLTAGIGTQGMILLAGCGFFFTVVSMAVPLLAVLRYRPGRMLQDR